MHGDIRVARLNGTEEIGLEQTPISEPESKEVQIKVQYCGICGTDLHAYLGKHPFINPPVIPGHEFVGKIETIGDEVMNESLSPGDFVTMEPSITCGVCSQCRSGKYHICQELKVFGCQMDGALAEYVNVPAEKVVKIPPELGIEGVMVEPAAVGVHAVGKTPIVNSKVLVVGAGPIGLLTAQAANFFGANTVAVSDLRQDRLNMAQQLGIDSQILVEENNSEGTGQSKTGDAFDLVFECSGTRGGINSAIDQVKKGGQIVLIGVFEGRVHAQLNLVQDRELNLTGSIMYRRPDFLLASELIYQGKIEAKPLLTDQFPLEKTEEAFQKLIGARSEALKGVITL